MKGQESGGHPKNKRKVINFLYYLTKDGLHLCVCVERGGGAGYGGREDRLLRYDVIFYFK